MTAWRHLRAVHAPIAAMGRLVTMVTITTTDIETTIQELVNPEEELYINYQLNALTIIYS